MKPLVSIIMPCYNAQRFIAQSIDSVLSQTYENWELLIVDDFSKDSSIRIINNYLERDNRIHLTKSAENKGVALSRNIALRQAEGKYVAFLDSDDIWTCDKLSLQLDFMQKNNYCFTYTAYNLIDEDSKSKNKIVHTAGNLTYKKYLKNTVIGCSTVIIDVEKSGMLECPDYQYCDDLGLWLSLLKKGFKAYSFEKVLTSYRITKSYTSAKSLDSVRFIWNYYRHHENISFLNACYFFMCYLLNAIKKRFF